MNKHLKEVSETGVCEFICHYCEIVEKCSQIKSMDQREERKALAKEALKRGTH